jgi:hypothetical protein
MAHVSNGTAHHSSRFRSSNDIAAQLRHQLSPSRGPRTCHRPASALAIMSGRGPGSSSNRKGISSLARYA